MTLVLLGLEVQKAPFVLQGHVQNLMSSDYLSHLPFFFQSADPWAVLPHFFKILPPNLISLSSTTLTLIISDYDILPVSWPLGSSPPITLTFHPTCSSLPHVLTITTSNGCPFLVSVPSVPIHHHLLSLQPAPSIFLTPSSSPATWLYNPSILSPLSLFLTSLLSSLPSSTIKHEPLIRSPFRVPT